MKEIPVGLTYDDVLIVPTYSEVMSRTAVSTKTYFTRNFSIDIPLVSANMDTVTEEYMASAMARAGGVGVIHRNQPFSMQAGQVALAKKVNKNHSIAAAIGVHSWKERSDALVDAGVDILVVDIAHGDSLHCIDTVENIRKRHGWTQIVAGNVVTSEAAVRLVNAGADAIKVGIGPGAACTTRIMTGVGYPQFSAIQAVCEPMNNFNVPVIADGGIRTPGDVAKALAAGASSVMIGNLFAGTDESPGALFGDSEHGTYKQYRGMASTEASGRTHAEGISGYVEYRGAVDSIIAHLMGGLCSAMSYVGAMNLEEFRKNASFIRITNAGLIESEPHDMFEIGEKNE